MTKIDILAMGEPMVEFNQIKSQGDSKFLQGFGGDTSNFVIAAARQGASVGYVSALGADKFGSMLRDLWKTERVDTAHVREDKEGFTAIYFVTHDVNGHDFSFFRSGSAASRYRSVDLPLQAISKAKLFHLSGISLAISNSACDAGFSAMESARKAGVLVSFDTNFRPKLWPIARGRAIISDAIARSDICLPSYGDVVELFGENDEVRLAKLILTMGPKLVALKLGARGTLLAQADRCVHIDPHPCNPVDATGAGDTFGGAFCARLIAGDMPEVAARYAAVAAALSTEGYGAVAPIPSAEAVRAELNVT